jgi:pimeloyl-ACP methyl ester carboxylesterase
MELIVAVRAKTRLRVTYSFHAAHGAEGRGVIVMHHGICHTREHYQPLIEALTERGFDVLMVDQQSEAAGFFRNAIGLGAYIRGMKAAMDEFQAHEGIHGKGQQPIVAYALHSMGALIGEAMQQQYPKLRRPTVLLASIPAGGAFPATFRILCREPFSYLWAVSTLNLLHLARSPEQVRKLFFDGGTAEATVEDAHRKLKHSPFWAYCQLVLRPLLRPWIWGDQPRKRLLYSDHDEIFHPRQYPSEIRTRENQIEGGHDFFIEHAAAVADRIAIFVPERSLQPDIADKLRIDLPVAPVPRRPYFLRLRDLVQAVWRGMKRQIQRMRRFGSH